MTQNLNIMCWNCKGIMSAVPYLSNCLKKQNIDICALSEHWLRKCNIHFLEQIDSQYKPYSKSIDELLPTSQQCKNYRKGVALLVSRQLEPFVVQEVDIDTDRIIGIDIKLPNCETIFIFSIYLPASSMPLDVFIDHVDTLHEIYSIYSQRGIVIFAGDFNVQVHGPRLAFTDNERTLYFARTLCELRTISLTVQDFCTGPVHTFQGFENGPCSTIDHIIVPSEMPFEVDKVIVLDDHGLNVSDHNPVICSLAIKLQTTFLCDMSNMQTRVAWDKAVDNNCISDYTFAVSQNLWGIQMNASNIESFYSEIIKAIHDAARDTLPHITFKKHLKPYWNAVLTETHREMMFYRTIWINEQRPRGVNFSSYVNYKSAKDCFRRELRKAYENHILSVSEEIEGFIEINQKRAWSIINSRRTKNTSVISLKNNGKHITDPTEVSNEFANHFEKIAQISVKEDALNDKVQNIRNTCGKENTTPVTIAELSKPPK